MFIKYSGEHYKSFYTLESVKYKLETFHCEKSV